MLHLQASFLQKALESRAEASLAARSAARNPKNGLEAWRGIINLDFQLRAVPGEASQDACHSFLSEISCKVTLVDGDAALDFVYKWVLCSDGRPLRAGCKAIALARKARNGPWIAVDAKGWAAPQHGTSGRTSRFQSNLVI